jgi:hypothetical protein
LIGTSARRGIEPLVRARFYGEKMLTDQQQTDVWERQIQAEVRALYFAELTHDYARRKQRITFLTFFLSSGAAATIISKAPSWVAITLSVFAAALAAYSVAVGLDSRVATLSKLHGDWALLAIEYERLCNDPEADNATNLLERLLLRDVDASRLATTDAPYDSKRMDRWTDHVFEIHRLVHG